MSCRGGQMFPQNNDSIQMEFVRDQFKWYADDDNDDDDDCDNDYDDDDDDDDDVDDVDNHKQIERRCWKEWGN